MPKSKCSRRSKELCEETAGGVAVSPTACKQTPQLTDFMEALRVSNIVRDAMFGIVCLHTIAGRLPHYVRCYDELILTPLCPLLYFNRGLYIRIRDSQ